MRQAYITSTRHPQYHYLLQGYGIATPTPIPKPLLCNTILTSTARHTTSLLYLNTYTYQPRQHPATVLPIVWYANTTTQEAANLHITAHASSSNHVLLKSSFRSAPCPQQTVSAHLLRPAIIQPTFLRLHICTAHSRTAVYSTTAQLQAVKYIDAGAVMTSCTNVHGVSLLHTTRRHVTPSGDIPRRRHY